MKDSVRILFSERELDPQPLSALDVALYGNNTVTFFYDHVLCDKILVDSLKKVLFLNPYLSGRIKNLGTRNPVITACDSGVLFFVESYSKKIKDIKYFDATTDEDSPLFQVKLSKDKNSSILSVTYNHSIGDGRSLFDFLHYWSLFARGQNVGTFDFDRLAYKNIVSSNIIRQEMEFPIFKLERNVVYPVVNKTKTFILTSEFINNLLGMALKKGIRYDNERRLKNSLWTAYIWKLITLSQGHRNKNTTLINAYETRKLLGLSKNYLGNVGVLASLSIDRIAFQDMEVDTIAKKILDLRDKLSESQNNLSASITSMENQLKNGKQYLYKTYKDFWNGELLFNNLTAFPIYEMDFGSGCPVWFEPPWRKQILRYVVATSSPKKNGDVILYISLPIKEMKKLSKELSQI